MRPTRRPPALGARTGADPAAVRAGAAEEAMAHVKSLRPHVSLGEAQQRAVQAFAEHCKASGGGGLLQLSSLR